MLFLFNDNSPWAGPKLIWACQYNAQLILGWPKARSIQFRSMLARPILTPSYIQ